MTWHVQPEAEKTVFIQRIRKILVPEGKRGWQALPRFYVSFQFRMNLYTVTKCVKMECLNMRILKRAVYWSIYGITKLVYPKTQLIGLEHLPEDPCLIVSNHGQIHGPVLGEIYFPGARYIWCASEMMHLKEVPAYAYQDFWARKPRKVRWFYKLLSYLIAPVSALVFNLADTIPVYHDKRVVTTFRETVEKLQEGANVIVFPEHDVPYNHILCEFQDGFVSVARSYYRQTGKALSFVPMYLCPSLKKMVLGKAVLFDPEAPIKEERRRISEALMQSITELAVALPRHRVVPYRNIPKKEYGYNIPSEVDSYEKTSC